VDLSVQLLGDASKNCLVWVRGRVLADDPEDRPMVEFLNLEEISTSASGRRPRSLQLASALWTIQEKMGFYVWMSMSRRTEDLLLVMESRNFIRFDRALLLDKWPGKLYLEPFNVTEPKWFWFQLDFDKVFER
jgi:hypothetical protein